MGRLQVGPKNGELAVTTVVFAVLVKLIRGPIELKNVQKYGKSPKGGGGVSTKNQKVQNSGLFDKMWGRLYFYFFPNVNVDFKCIR